MSGGGKETYITRRDALKYIGTGVVAVAVGGLGGRLLGSSEERAKHLSPGQLSPELRDKLKTAYFIHEPNGETIASLRAAGMDIPTFPLLVAEGQPDPEAVPSKRRFIAVKNGEVYLPSEEGATVKDLNTLVNRQSSAVRALDGGFQAVTPELIDLLGLEHAHLSRTGETLLTEPGYVLTATKIGNEGIAIGRPAPGEPLGYSVVDVSSQNPAPSSDRIQVVGVVTAR